MKCKTLYPLTKILDQSKLKAFADDNLKVIEMTKFIADRIEKLVGNSENAGYPGSFLGSLKVGIVW